MGRLFDAVAALCGVRTRVNYEGQAAAELEAAADPGETGAYPLPAERSCSIRARRVLAVARDIAAGVPVGDCLRPLPQRARRRRRRRPARGGREPQESTIVVLSGGVFQNALLLERTSAALSAGLRVLVPERLPPNDGGISYGQAAVAAARITP